VSGNNAKDILSAVKTTLTASPSLINSTCLKQIVIGRDSDASSGFPFVKIYLNDFSSPIADTVSYERTYGIMVEVWQEASAKSKENAELDFANAVHQVLNRLQATGGTPPTWQLGVGVELTEVQPSPVRYVEVAQGAMLIAPIRLVVTTLIQNPS
jgi:hypothetical protein